MKINGVIDLSVKPAYADVLTDEQLAIFKEPDKKYMYNDDVATAIINQYHLVLTNEEQAILKTYVYIAHTQLRKMREEEKISKMEAEGWKRLTRETAKDLHGKKILLNCTQDIDWFTRKVENVYKVYVRPGTDEVYIMKPRATRYGTALANLNRPMYKLV
ncbi:MAG: hypothetical protein AB7U82_28710 [Blastocatellales bacterium]